MSHNMSQKDWIYIGAIGASIIGLLFLGVYTYQMQRNLNAQIKDLEGTLKTTQQQVIEKNLEIAEYNTNLDELKKSFELSEENGAELLDQLTEERDRNENFEKKINKITGTVGKLDKLSKIDPELLIKYSRVYFLNENYAPAKVAEIDSDFRFKSDEPEYMNAKVIPFLEDLLQDAQDDQIDIRILSGYRSFDEQKDLKGTYTVLYGTGANAFSADQGYSEHQLGTTVDFTTPTVGASLVGFDQSTAYDWLKKNAYKYGFILSYPKENSYYTFEPWHWRFVGQDLAKDLRDDGKSFYDLDQRELDTYLIKLFD